ncbi:MAG: ParB/RepB/Spo0J family partition protein [Terracidiphilus sp.]|nr:ParB/RepB/Spo0J family partition protein [Terracidiphilus sp.]
MKIESIVLSRLHVAPWNARKTFDPATIAELAESIRQHQIQVPLTVRPLRDLEGDGEQYEIVAGHRRLEAARRALLDSAPCIVRELTDDEAREIGLIDNLQRENVPAIEEAEAFGELLERLGSIAFVAAMVGKEQGYVAKRLKLRTLTLCSQDALRGQLITIDHALLLCRLAETEQNAALKWCLDRSAGSKTPVEKVIEDRQKRLKRLKPEPEDEDEEDTDQASRRPSFRHTWEPETVQRLKGHIEVESGTPLDRAPWPMEEDRLLPDAGSCLDCEKNTKANAPLFGDLDMGVAICTDGACFKDKAEAFVLYGIEAAKKDDAKLPVLRVSWKETSKEPRMTIGEPCDGPKSLNNFTRVPKLDQIFRAGQWVEAKKKCEHARQAVTTDWSDCNNRGYMGRDEKLRKPGELIQVCVQPKCKMHPKAYKRTSPAVKNEKNEAEQKARAAAEMEKFNAFRAAEKSVREALYEAIRAGIKPETVKRNLLANALDWQARRALCWAAGFESDCFDEREAYTRQRVKKATAADLDALLFDATFGRLLIVDLDAMRAKDRGRAGLRKLAEVAGVDAAAIERKFEKPAAKAAPKKAVKPAAKKAPAKKPTAKKAPAKKAAKKGGKS